MRKFVAILFAAVILFSCAFAEWDWSEWTDDDLSAVIISAEAELDRRNKEREGNGALLVNEMRTCHVELISLNVAESYGRNVLVAELTFTNLDNSARQYILTAGLTVYQNGIALKDAYLVDGVDTSMNSAKIKNGTTVTVYELFYIDDMDTMLDIELADWLGNNPVSGMFAVPK